MNRARSFTQQEYEKFTTNLQATLEKYDLNNSPQLIYNIDESGFYPDHTPPLVIAEKKKQPML
jgi:hypothetical protein